MVEAAISSLTDDNGVEKLRTRRYGTNQTKQKANKLAVGGPHESGEERYRQETDVESNRQRVVEHFDRGYRYR
jgi:hypothetical protein